MSLQMVEPAAREHTTEAIERLAYWMRSDDAVASIATAIALLDLGWGKPKQVVEHVRPAEGGVFCEPAAESAVRAKH